MFDKDMDNPLAHMSVAERKFFLMGDHEERLEITKHPTVKHREAIARGFVFEQERAQRLRKRKEEEDRYERLEMMKVREEHRYTQTPSLGCERTRVPLTRKHAHLHIRTQCQARRDPGE
jgi:hypothetical protein